MRPIFEGDLRAPAEHVPAPAPVRRRGLRQVATLMLTTVTVVVAVLALFVPSVFSSVLRGTQVWPAGDRYTALYFTHPNHLAIRPGPSRMLPVSFTVENHGQARRRYSYEVWTVPSSGPQRVGVSGELTVAAGRSATRTVEVWPVPPGRSMVQVRLLDGGTAISYWTS